MIRAPKKTKTQTKRTASKPTVKTLTRKEQYDRDNTKGLYIKLNKKTDADILEALNEVKNKQGLVKALLRLNGYGDRDKAPSASEILKALSEE